MTATVSYEKKKVAAEWQSSFPELTQYAENKLYKLLGPLIIGIELIKLPRSPKYRPHFRYKHNLFIKLYFL